MPDELKVLDAMAEGWPEITRDSGLRVNHCILAARVAVETGAYFGLTIRERAVKFLMLNAKANDLASADVPVEDWPDDAWSVGIDPTDQRSEKMDGYSGHVIAESDHYILDLSAPQFDRPGLLVADEPIILPRGGDPSERWVYGDDLGQVLIYEPMDDRSYRKTPDWANPFWRELTAALIRWVREEIHASEVL